jgi:hypothetical protein
MVQLLLHFRSKEREKSHSHIGNIRKLKLSKHQVGHYILSPLTVVPTEQRLYVGYRRIPVLSVLLAIEGLKI